MNPFLFALAIVAAVVEPPAVVDRPISVAPGQHLKGRGVSETTVQMAKNFAGPAFVVGVDPRGFDPAAHCPRGRVPGSNAYRTAGTALLGFPGVRPSGPYATFYAVLGASRGVPPKGPVATVGEINSGSFHLIHAGGGQYTLQVRSDDPAERFGGPARTFRFAIPPGIPDLLGIVVAVDLPANRVTVWAGDFRNPARVADGPTVPTDPTLPPLGPGSAFKSSDWRSPFVVGGMGNSIVESSSALVDQEVHALKLRTARVYDPDSPTLRHLDGSPVSPGFDFVSNDTDTLLGLSNRPMEFGRLVHYWCGGFNYAYGYFMDATSQIAGSGLQRGQVQGGGSNASADVRISDFTLRGYPLPRGVGIAEGSTNDLSVQRVNFENVDDGFLSLQVGSKWYTKFADCRFRYSRLTLWDSVVRLDRLRFAGNHGVSLRASGCALTARGLILDQPAEDFDGPLIDLRAAPYSYGSDLEIDFFDGEGLRPRCLISAENHPYGKAFLRLRAGHVGYCKKGIVELVGRPGFVTGEYTLDILRKWGKEDDTVTDGDPNGWKVAH